MMQNKVKLFISDIDGTLTDGMIYYSSKGEELKMFNMKDGRGLEVLGEQTKVKAFLLTSSVDGISDARAQKLIKLGAIEKYFDGFYTQGKKNILKELCLKYNCNLSECAYIGDDTNDMECLQSVGYPACPVDAHKDIKNIDNIYVTGSKGGQGAVREFIDYLIENNLVYNEG